MIKVLVALLLLGFVSYAQDLDLNTVMSMPRDIRSMTMGDAFTGLGEGEGALFHNPAGLAMPGGSYGYHILDYNQSYYDRYDVHVLYSSPIGFSNVSFQKENGDSFDMNILGYGKRTGNGIDWGVTYKSVKTDLKGVLDEGWSSDVGIKARVFPFMNVGLKVSDVFKQNIKPTTGYATGLAFYNHERSLVFAADIKSKKVITGERHLSSHYGGEVKVTDGFYARAGWSDHTYTAGLHFIFPIFELQFGVRARAGSESDSEYMLGFTFGGGVDQNKIKKRYALFKPKAYAEFALGGNITTGRSEVSLLGGLKIGTNDLLYLIHKAVEDPSCQGFLIRVGNLSSSMGSVSMIQEIRHELLRAKRLGKEVIVYLEQWATLSEYYIASVADRIVMPELGTISHLGLDVEVTKMTQFLKNFGMEYQTVTSGKLKGSLNPNTKSLNEHSRAYVEDLVSGLYQHVLEDIKSSREGLDWDKVQPYFDGRFITGREAKRIGLVDSLVYYKNIDEYLSKSDLNETLGKVSLVEFLDIYAERSLFSFDRIAVVEIDGTIMSGQSKTGFFFGGKTTGADFIESVVDSLKKDRAVKGVIFRINSPGGGVMASDRIYESIRELSDSKKLVYASLGNMAASGGYYSALGAEKIFANKSTLTGSVGVISSYLTLIGMSDKLGIDVESISTGEHMNIMSKYESLTDEQKRMVQAHQDSFYQRFVDVLVESRGITRDEAYDIAQGNVISGENAYKLKMVDQIGSFYDALEDLSDELDIEEPELVFYRPKQEFSLPVGGVRAMMKHFGLEKILSGFSRSNGFYFEGPDLD